MSGLNRANTYNNFLFSPFVPPFFLIERAIQAQSGQILVTSPFGEPISNFSQKTNYGPQKESRVHISASPDSPDQPLAIFYSLSHAMVGKSANYIS
jgi:hypothetical protein